MAPRRFNIWSWDPGNRQWLEVSPDLTEAEARDALARKHSSANADGVPWQWFISLPASQRPQSAPTPMDYPQRPAAVTVPEGAGLSAAELPRAGQRAGTDQYGLPEWRQGDTVATYAANRADSLTEMALNCVQDQPMAVRAQVYATLALAERHAQVADLLDDIKIRLEGMG